MEGLIGGIVGGLLSGALAAIGAVWAYAHGYLRLERNEKRLAKVRLVDDVIAFRFVLDANYPVSELDAHHFNKTICRIPYVFGDDKKVMESYDEFMASPNDTPKLLYLLRQISAAAEIENGLPERYVSGVYLIRPRRDH